MRSAIHNVTFDCRDPYALASFWSQVFDRPLHDDDHPGDPEAIVYETRFLAWWGLWLYLGQLGSRRQLDFQLDAWGTRVLDGACEPKSEGRDRALSYGHGRPVCSKLAELATRPEQLRLLFRPWRRRPFARVRAR